jgi:hypothetical protein
VKKKKTGRAGILRGFPGEVRFREEKQSYALRALEDAELRMTQRLVEQCQSL